MKFKNVKIEQDFIYNELIYTKKESGLAFNDRYGSFVIHPNEKVKMIKTKMNISNFLPTIIFTFGCFIGVIIFWILMLCN